jgi:uncharacterized protein with GYD domain
VEEDMPAYIILNKFTEQGVRSVKDTVKRGEAIRKAIEGVGGRLIGIWWTQGQYDSVSIVEVPDEETGMALLLSTGMQGNIRTETLRAFSEEDMTRILQRVP